MAVNLNNKTIREKQCVSHMLLLHSPRFSINNPVVASHFKAHSLKNSQKYSGWQERCPFQIVLFVNFREKQRKNEDFLREKGWSKEYSGSWLKSGWGGSKMNWSRGILYLYGSGFCLI